MDDQSRIPDETANGGPTHNRPLQSRAQKVIEDIVFEQPASVSELTEHEVEQIEPEHITGRVTATISVLVLAALVAMLNETALSVALPAVMADLNVVASTAQWLTTGFMLVMAIVIPTTGFLLQRFTTRALFGAAIVVFLAGTVLAAFAPSFGWLLIARFLQAGGTAVILPQLMATTLTAVPVKHRGTVMGLNSVVISAAPALGPTMSGFVVDALGWRWLFGIMAPIALVLLIAGLVILRTDGDTRKAPFDVPSVILAALGFGGLVYGLSSIGAVLNGAWVPLVVLVIGLAALVVFVNRQLQLQRRTGAALLDLAPFSVPTFRWSVIIVVIAMATMLGTVMVLPIHLQLGMGVSTMLTGLLLLPGGLIQGVISPAAGKLYDVFGPRPLVIPGVVLLAVGQFWMSTIGTQTPLWYVVSAHVLFCIGMAAVMTPLMTVSLSSLPRHLYGHGSAIMNTLQQLAGAAGTAILIAAMSLGAARAATGGAEAATAQATGTQLAFIVGGIIALVAVAVSPLVKRLPVAPSAAPAEASAAEDQTESVSVNA
ncbi:MFS transporter, DHA2 family, lincomycin resistance protein [Raineyella antarctica]|uniref:MFS transporter, DHA2 family, lincomycin resistance protein n=1 Tax=Raineyella antarctica TaxID=1577474 RepID=A0A1G6GNA5_9ACTN|nr:MDR family MFS transporter [Raineyella antarctica]SDB83313.1 MFS transporter, DHA2 family, lincomycin resistance protein [Raineyella antarctica]